MDIRDCRICPRNCGVDRIKEVGYCGAGAEMRVNLAQLHFGEEPNLSCSKGSGTIFFSHCNMRCVYCQNFTISQFAWGKEISVSELVEMMLKLQKSGGNNINLVTATQFTPNVIEAITMAKSEGLNLPIVWNSNAYESVDTLKHLENLIDIYLPDFRYYEREAAGKYSDAEDYPEVAKRAIMEMYRQVGHIKEVDGCAVSGLMIRLLMLPGNVNRIDLIMEWIFDQLGSKTFISLMGQYYPTYRAVAFPEMNRGLSEEEYNYAVEMLESFGFENGFIQERGSSKDWTPEFEE